MTSLNPPMEQVVIYHNPKDFPGKFVARRWEIQEGAIAAKEVLKTSESIDEVRESVPEWMAPIMRSPSDDPCIVETWI